MRCDVLDKYIGLPDPKVPLRSGPWNFKRPHGNLVSLCIAFGCGRRLGGARKWLVTDYPDGIGPD
jgi:hypothetical protein